MSSSGETFLDSRRALFSSALAVFFSVFSFPLPGFFVFFPMGSTTVELPLFCCVSKRAAFKQMRFSWEAETFFRVFWVFISRRKSNRVDNSCGSAGLLCSFDFDALGIPFRPHLASKIGLIKISLNLVKSPLIN